MSLYSATAQPRWRKHQRAAVLITALALGSSFAVGGLVAPAIAADTANLTGIILGVGANETQRIVTWYSSADTVQSVQVVPTSTIVGGVFPGTVSSFSALGAANIATSGGFNRHATISGLSENTAYSYRVGSEGNWSATYAFKTQSFNGAFEFLFFGDPQIGASGNVAKDQAGWQDTLEIGDWVQVTGGFAVNPGSAGAAPIVLVPESTEPVEEPDEPYIF